MEKPESRFVVCEDGFNGCKYEVVLRNGEMRPVFSWRRHIQKRGKRVRYGWHVIEASNHDELLLKLASAESSYIDLLVFGLKLSLIDPKVTLQKLAEAGALGYGISSYEPRRIYVRDSLLSHPYEHVIRVMTQWGWEQVGSSYKDVGVLKTMLRYRRRQRA